MTIPPTGSVAEAPTQPPMAGPLLRFRRSAVETFGTLVVSTGVAAVYGILIARTLGPSGKGVLSVLFLLPAVATLLLGGALELANTYIGSARPDERPRLAANSLLVAGLGGLGIAGVTALGLLGAGTRFGATWTEVALVLGSIPLTIAQRLIGILVLTDGRSRTYNALNVLGQILLLPLTAVAFATFGTGLLAVAIAYATTQAAAAGATAWASRIVPGRPSMSLLAESFRYGTRGVLANIVQFFNYRLDFFLLSSLSGPAAVGIYSVAVTVGELPWKIPTAASTILFPRVSATAQGDAAFTARVARVVVMLTTLAAAAAAGAAYFLIPLLFGESFSGAFVPLLLLLPGVVALGLTSVVSSHFAGRGQLQWATYAAALGLALTIPLCAILIPSYGATGAALASTVAYVVTTCVMVAAFCRRFAVGLRELLLPRWDDFRRTR